MTLYSQLKFNDVSEEKVFYWRVQSDIRGDGDLCVHSWENLKPAKRYVTLCVVLDGTANDC
jgi:hypothetical protein